MKNLFKLLITVIMAVATFSCDQEDISPDDPNKPIKVDSTLRYSESIVWDPIVKIVGWAEDEFVWYFGRKVIEVTNPNWKGDPDTLVQITEKLNKEFWKLPIIGEVEGGVFYRVELGALKVELNGNDLSQYNDPYSSKKIETSIKKSSYSNELTQDSIVKLLVKTKNVYMHRVTTDDFGDQVRVSISLLGDTIRDGKDDTFFIHLGWGGDLPITLFKKLAASDNTEYDYPQRFFDERFEGRSFTFDGRTIVSHKVHKTISQIKDWKDDTREGAEKFDPKIAYPVVQFIEGDSIFWEGIIAQCLDYYYTYEGDSLEMQTQFSAFRQNGDRTHSFGMEAYYGSSIAFHRFDPLNHVDHTTTQSKRYPAESDLRGRHFKQMTDQITWYEF